MNNNSQFQSIEEELKGFARAYESTNQAKSLIEEIFDINLSRYENDIIYRNLTDHLSNAFRFNANAFMLYIADGNFEIPKDLINDKQTQKQFELLKKKYGFFIGKLLIRQSNPFILDSIEINMKPGGFTHNLSLYRNDEKGIEGQFTAESIQKLHRVITAGLQRAITDGVYDLNESDINLTIKLNNDLNNVLNDLLKKHES